MTRGSLVWKDVLRDVWILLKVCSVLEFLRGVNVTVWFCLFHHDSEDESVSLPLFDGVRQSLTFVAMVIS